MKRATSVLLCILIALSTVVGFSSETSFLEDYDAIENASNSVLYIEVFGYGSEAIATGSGFVAFNDKTLVTNHHVIKDAISIRVYDEDFREYIVDKTIATDKERDIAIISFKSATRLNPLDLAANPDLKRGQPVAAIGYPKGLFNTFSMGNISALLDFDGIKEIQFTAPISPGSSGGALFNDKGEVIGITSAYIQDGQNINFSVAISHVIDLYRQYNPNYSAPKASPRLIPSSLTSSNPIAAFTPKPTLAAPENLKVQQDRGMVVSLEWSSVSNASHYRLFRSHEENGAFELVATIYSCTSMDWSIKEGTTYYYKVESVDKEGNRSEKSAASRIDIPKNSQTTIPKSDQTQKPTLTFVPPEAGRMLHIIDQAGTFTQQQKQTLEIHMQLIYYVYGFDTVIVTTNDSKGQSAQMYAADFYDEFRSYSDYPNGLIFSFNFDLGDYYEATRGVAQTLFSDRGEAELDAALRPHFSKKDYFGAMQAYLDYVEEVLAEVVARE